MSFLDLTAEEKFVYEWQSGMAGSYMTALAELICKGDLWHQAKLAEVYPEAVAGIQKYQTQSGWWEKVQETARA